MYVCMYVFMYEPSHPPSSLDMHWVFYAAILGSILWFDQSGSCKVFVCGECARREELGEGVLVYTIGYWNDLDVLLCNLAECSGALFGAYRAAGGRDWAAIPAQRFNRFPSFQNDTYASSELQGPSTGAER